MGQENETGMTIYLDRMSLDELKALQIKVKEAIKAAEAERKKAALAAAQAAARTTQGAGRMTPDLFNQRDISRLSLDDRSKPLAIITYNDAPNCIISTQSAGYPQSRSQKMTASSASNTVDRALVAKSAPPATTLSP
ncbi:hypothetical protein GTA62_20565 [Roseobacter sp. HKCCD9010]|uniref:hypothetical protein n=1 Tax=unclassified Roseobacter TaxID=196798 RepID=UPI001491DD07|nr:MULTISPECIES: hypothetical protein [unclassified Roseobacter]MBF9052389.1 hypothetical protein [Rhodobacterales bacterium HKCCD4356]NNV13718.1 hypothetical protein [Roseobacter sp. HKCCD7357]NNV18556.1 hypothetical protein [Roseobacter sp. HKCCD8768]NNV28007.1 hypothetical protein [Roseobacter sp. HKCCD8192]NNV32307.1 hypothetical protein [Roseobacter sp. HKCCD9061]